MDQGLEHRPTSATREKVSAFAIAGFPQDWIARYFDICENTLLKHYKSELHNSRLDKLEGVVQSAWMKAMKGDPKMIELILRTQARWKNARDEDDKKGGMEALLEKLIDKL